jgi:hypothetical protein
VRGPASIEWCGEGVSARRWRHQERRKQTIAGVKDAVLPAWSTDGERLAYAQKSGRRKFRLMLVTLTRK